MVAGGLGDGLEVVGGVSDAALVVGEREPRPLLPGLLSVARSSAAAAAARGAGVGGGCGGQVGQVHPHHPVGLGKGGYSVIIPIVI